MLGYLLLIFIAVPLIDVALLFRIGTALGFWPTVWFIVITGFVGAALAKHQGLRTLARINTELSAGRMPTAELADGLLILLAGAVLITPGFLTDALGFLLLFPPFRRVFKRVLTRYFKARIVVPDMHAAPGQSTPRPDGSTDTMSDAGPHPSKYVENEALRK